MQPTRFARRAGASAAPAQRALDVSASAQRNVVASWITGPLAAAAFIPRLYIGTLAKGPAIVSDIADTLSDTSTALQDSTLTTGEKTVCGAAYERALIRTDTLNGLQSVVSSWIVPRYSL